MQHCKGMSFLQGWNNVTVESPCDIQCMIHKKGCNRLALVNTGMLLFRMLLFWVLLQSTNRARDSLNVKQSYGRSFGEPKTAKQTKKHAVLVCLDKTIVSLRKEKVSFASWLWNPRFRQTLCKSTPVDVYFQHSFCACTIFGFQMSRRVVSRAGRNSTGLSTAKDLKCQWLLPHKHQNSKPPAKIMESHSLLFLLNELPRLISLAKYIISAGCHQWFVFSRNISYVTPEITYFHYLEKYSGSKIPQNI